jgi:hypothetical protein
MEKSSKIATLVKKVGLEENDMRDLGKWLGPWSVIGLARIEDLLAYYR